MTRRTPQTPEARFDAHLRRAGLCSVCLRRDSTTHHGAGFCAGNYRRQFPTCTHDGRRPRFAPDIPAIQAITP